MSDAPSMLTVPGATLAHRQSGGALIAVQIAHDRPELVRAAVVMGTCEDVQTRPQRVREVAELAADGHFHVLEGLGHGSAFGHRPEVVNACLRGIVDGESGSGRAAGGVSSERDR